MSFTNRVSEEVELLGGAHADNVVPSTLTVGWFSVELFRSIRFLLDVGDIVATGTVDAVIQQATDSAGAGAKVLATTKAITQLTAAGGDSDDYLSLEVNAEEMDTNNDFTHVALIVTVGTADAELAVIAEGFHKRYLPVVTTPYTEVIT